MDVGDQRRGARPVHQDVQRAGRQLLEPGVRQATLAKKLVPGTVRSFRGLGVCGVLSFRPRVVAPFSYAPEKGTRYVVEDPPGRLRPNTKKRRLRRGLSFFLTIVVGSG